MERYRMMTDSKLLEEREIMLGIAAFNRGERAFAQAQLRLIIAEMLARGM